MDRLSQEHVIKKICDMQPQFKDLQQMQSFLGCLNWIQWDYTYLVEDTLLLTNLLHKNKKKWMEEHTIVVRKIQDHCK